MTDLRERALACKHWRWLPGMQTNRGRILRVDDDGYILMYRTVEFLGEMPKDALPDFYDPATVGCLLYLVQQDAGDVPAHPDAESLVQALEATNVKL